MLQALGFEPRYQGNRRDKAGNITSDTEGVISPDALQNFKKLVATPGAETYAAQIYRKFYSGRTGDPHAMAMEEILKDRSQSKENLERYRSGKKSAAKNDMFAEWSVTTPPTILFNDTGKRGKFSTETIPL